VDSCQKRRVLMSWELGGGMGHAARFAAFADGLGAHARPYIALRDLSQAASMANNASLTLLQAPLWLPEARGLPEAANYAELLFRAGFLDPVKLKAVVCAWRSMFTLVKPDLLLLDHAPTALLAARGLPIKKALIGTGFFTPPPISPMPPFRIWEKTSPARLHQAESIALNSANQVLEALGAPALGRLADLFEVDENFLTTWRELDHYPQRAEGTRYWGPEAMLTAGVEPRWPQGNGAAVFTYLTADYPHLKAVLDALKAAPVRTLAYIRGLSPAARASLEAPNLFISAEPVRLDEARARADLVVCHANAGTVSAVLQAGKPVVMLPLHAEQYLFALRVVETGAGVLLEPQGVLSKLPKLLKQMSGNCSQREAASQLAKKYGAQDMPGTIDRVIARCAELLNAGAIPQRGFAAARQ
jgi:Glycosyltransferase family 28 C-terminal domain